ncbi:InfA Translation initiation factor 1 (IF-1) [uncultured Caudovirales phage]|uniref:InfA Translation initiation factor 1 (IF-1) n=1 Tax=uncultured Caudovirales phage TaxID=2100421 RepID=A0A6J5T9X4_9CAUD|nr:InfA Translation initiation factor 1 (IF-1) [uncultured Caudovirales phage]
MSKEDNFVIQGRVSEALPGALFKVSLETGQEIIGHLAGKLRVNRITIILGDLVDVEMSVYDMSKGRITYRHKG